MYEKRKTTEVRCPCGRRHELDVTPSAGVDERGALVSLADGWQTLKANTLMRWAKEGRLPAFRLERGRYAAWERDIRNAVESDRVVPESRPSHARGDDDDQVVALRDALGGAA